MEPKENILQFETLQTATTQRKIDKDLAAACLCGDNSAKQQLAQRVFAPVVSIVSYASNNRAYVDDAVQDGLIAILDSMKYYRGDCSLETWARKIAIRTVTMQERKRKRRNALFRLFTPAQAVELPRGDQVVSDKELRFMLNHLVSRLPEKQQVALRLRFINDLSLKEISKIVDAPEETVRDRIKTGRNKLKKIITSNPAFEDWFNKRSRLL